MWEGRLGRRQNLYVCKAEFGLYQQFDSNGMQLVKLGHPINSLSAVMHMALLPKQNNQMAKGGIRVGTLAAMHGVCWMNLELSPPPRRRRWRAI